MTKKLKPMAIKNEQQFQDYIKSRTTFATTVDPRLTEPVQQHKRGPSNRRILIALGMALGCGLTLLVQLIFGG